MNWKKLLFNLAGAAIGAVGVGFSGAASTGTLSGKTIAVGAAGAAVANLVGLFQQPPHQDDASKG